MAVTLSVNLNVETASLTMARPVMMVTALLRPVHMVRLLVQSVLLRAFLNQERLLIVEMESLTVLKNVMVNLTATLSVDFRHRVALKMGVSRSNIIISNH